MACAPGSTVRCDLVEMELHGGSVAEGQDHGGAGATLEGRWRRIAKLTGCVDRVGRGGGYPSLPSIGELVLLPDFHLVLEPDLDWRAGRDLLPDFRHAVGKVFLKASSDSSF